MNAPSSFQVEAMRQLSAVLSAQAIPAEFRRIGQSAPYFVADFTFNGRSGTLQIYDGEIGLYVGGRHIVSELFPPAEDDVRLPDFTSRFEQLLKTGVWEDGTIAGTSPRGCLGWLWM